MYYYVVPRPTLLISRKSLLETDPLWEGKNGGLVLAGMVLTFRYPLFVQVKRVDLKEMVIHEIHEKRKNIETERQTMELSGGESNAI